MALTHLYGPNGLWAAATPGTPVYDDLISKGYTPTKPEGWVDKSGSGPPAQILPPGYPVGQQPGLNAAQKQRLLASYRLDLNRYVNDWKNYGMGNGIAIPGVANSESTGGALTAFLQKLQSKYNLSSLKSNWLTGDLGLPAGTKISQEDMWEWQKNVTAAKQGWFKALQVQSNIDWLTKGEKPPYTQAQIEKELKFSKPSWENKELISNPVAGQASPQTLTRSDVKQGVTLAQSPGAAELNRATTNLVNPTGDLAAPRGRRTRGIPSIAPAILTTGGKFRRQKRRSVINKDYLPFDGLGLRD